jgi:hypothetical protein
MNSFRRWLDNYEAKRHGGINDGVKENWISTKFDFSDPNVRLEYVPELRCNVGGCISSLKKSWKAYRIAKRYSPQETRYLSFRIRTLQEALGIETTDFEELDGLLPEESIDGVNQSTEDEELSNEEATLCREELQAEAE